MTKNNPLVVLWLVSVTIPRGAAFLSGFPVTLPCPAPTTTTACFSVLLKPQDVAPNTGPAISDAIPSKPPSSTKTWTRAKRFRDVRFMSPLLEYGYRPAVEDWESGKTLEKPLLLFLPGFDGTFLSPFVQFPELHTLFDVRCMTISTKDRSTYEELKVAVIDYLESVTLESETIAHESNNASSGGLFQRWFRGKPERRPIFLVGESFGSILALDVTLTLLAEQKQQSNDRDRRDALNLQGLCVINAATCYDRSRLAAEAPSVAQYPPWLYIFGLLKLLPLFSDEYSLDQLLLILKSEALPSVLNSETREAYMGRVALSLPAVIPFMDKGVLQWRLREWLAHGCNHMMLNGKLSEFANYPLFRTLIVAGEKDATLPSIEEAERLASLLPPLSTLHVVQDAGHASTCGARVDLAALFRLAFPDLTKGSNNSNNNKENDRDNDTSTRTSMSGIAASGEGPYFGMEPRYDNATIGLSPLKYWSSKYFKRPFSTH